MVWRSADNLSAGQREFAAVAEAWLPLVVFPQAPGIDPDQQVDALQACIERYLPRVGSTLFRGFATSEHHSFHRFLEGLGGTGRRVTLAPTRIEGFQNTGWYRARRPERLWFHCQEAGASVAIADGRRVLARLSPELRDVWERRGVRVERVFSAFGAHCWPNAFGTLDRCTVEQWCALEGFACEWRVGGGLRLSKVCAPIERHSRSGQSFWLNAAHGFDDWAGGQESINASAFTVTHGDGRIFAERDLQAIRRAVELERVVFACEPGDVFLLDNLLSAHAVVSDCSRDPGLSMVAEYVESDRAVGIDPFV